MAKSPKLKTDPVKLSAKSLQRVRGRFDGDELLTKFSQGRALGQAQRQFLRATLNQSDVERMIADPECAPQAWKQLCKLRALLYGRKAGPPGSNPPAYVRVRLALTDFDKGGPGSHTVSGGGANGTGRRR